MNFKLKNKQIEAEVGDLIECNGGVWIIIYRECSEDYTLVDLDEGYEDINSYNSIPELLEREFKQPFRIIKSSNVTIIEN